MRVVLKITLPPFSLLVVYRLAILMVDCIHQRQAWPSLHRSQGISEIYTRHRAGHDVFRVLLPQPELGQGQAAACALHGRTEVALLPPGGEARTVGSHVAAHLPRRHQSVSERPKSQRTVGREAGHQGFAAPAPPAQYRHSLLLAGAPGRG